METIWITYSIYMGFMTLIIAVINWKFKYGYFINILWIAAMGYGIYRAWPLDHFAYVLLMVICPLLFINVVLLVYIGKDEEKEKVPKKYKAILKTRSKRLTLNNIRRGISIIGAAGSGKTESVVYELLKHFQKYEFSGVVHDYKNFEITEMAYPLFQRKGIETYIISFDPIYDKVNPIAPRYLPYEESVNEVSRVLIENLLEIGQSDMTTTTRFFHDSVEGLLAGMIWRLRTYYPEFCTLPHLIALYQQMNTEELVSFVSRDRTSRAMADAFVSSLGSDRQGAGIKATLSNAFKKISTERIFMTLCEDQVPLAVNAGEKPAVIFVVNNPKYESSLSPVISTIMHTITKQMSERNKRSSFLLMEEAPTIKLLNMHRIPATLRSYDIITVYVMQDKIQNDIMYGDQQSKAILSNLSYQFFGKVNDPDTAKYYERFFEIVKKETTSINRGYNLDFDTRITKGEKEVAKTRASAFYGLQQGEFIVFHDGKDKKVRFKRPRIQRALPEPRTISKDELKENFLRIYSEVKIIIAREHTG